MLYYFLQSTFQVTILHKYLGVGHTHMECSLGLVTLTWSVTVFIGVGHTHMVCDSVHWGWSHSHGVFIGVGHTHMVCDSVH